MPDYLRGKSADETLDIVSKMEAAIRYAATAHNVTPPAQPVVTMPEPTVQIDDDLLVTNPAEWRRRFAADQEQRMNATLAQVAQPVFNNMAATAAEMARKDDSNKDVAEKWWSEVEQVVGPVPTHMRSKQLYDQAARLVRSNHLDEIATERAQRLAASGTGVEGVTRSGGTEGREPPAVEAAWSKLAASPLGAKMIERYGRSKVTQVAQQFGGLEKYADMVSGSRTHFDPDKPGVMRTELV